MTWQEKKEVKKGDIGEEIVKNYLENKGWIVYKPETIGAHYFDMICTKNKKKVIAIDVKTKARLNKYAATGINKKHYLDYKRFSNDTEIPFYLYFVDDKEGKVYYQLLNDLPEPFELNNKIVCWYLKDLIYIFDLTEEQIIKLTELDTRTHIYKPI
jgi:hypothetical protein